MYTTSPPPPMYTNNVTEGRGIGLYVDATPTPLLLLCNYTNNYTVEGGGTTLYGADGELDDIIFSICTTSPSPKYTNNSMGEGGEYTLHTCDISPPYVYNMIPSPYVYK